MIDISYISKFLNTDGVEGPQELRGYIPCKPRNFYGNKDQNPALFTAFGASGVTIATGADLGQTNAKTMLGYGLDTSIVELFSPYYGLKKNVAIQKLMENPLSISKSVADAVDTALHSGYARLVEARYNRESPRTEFSNLPKQAQAVIFSMCYQMGCSGGPNTGPKTWAALVDGDWEDASQRLRNKSLWSAYQLRRSIEGTLLKEIA